MSSRIARHRRRFCRAASARHRAALPGRGPEPVDGLGDMQEYQIVTSIQASVYANFTQRLTSAALSQLGTFAVMPASLDGG
jgi:hypothetical protein